jgi:hypothetical protein
LRLSHRDARLEAAEDGDDVVETDFLGGIDGERGVDVAAGDEAERGGRDADHGGGLAVERDGAADERGVRTEAALPEAFAEHDDGRSAGFFFVVIEVAAGEGLEAENAGEGGTDEVARELFRVTGAGEGVVVVAEGSDLPEGAILLAPVEEVENGRAPDGEVELVVFLGDLDEGGGITEGKRAEKNGIHDAEDGDIGTDGQGDGEDDSCGEERGFPHDAEGVDEVVHRFVSFRR